MVNTPKIRNDIIEQVAKVLADAGSGSEISTIFHQLGIDDNSEGCTKWRRIYAIFINAQDRDGNASRLIQFIIKSLSPVRFRNDPQKLSRLIEDLNRVLIFAGLKYTEDGKFYFVREAETVSEAQRRASSLRQKLISRGAHPETLKYCTAELIGNDAFHAVFEACKGIFERIRNMTCLTLDGNKLIDEAFGGDKPILALNFLRTETEKSEQNGLMFLLKGCASGCRNPKAHEPRILWSGTDDDALDSLVLISMLHKKLDKCVSTGYRK